MKYKNIAVLMGGVSKEREISLKSGDAVAQALLEKGFKVSKIDLQDLSHLKELKKFDKVFITLHGGWGENGVLQAHLEQLGIPYTGSNMAASAIAMNKLTTKLMWRGAGLPTPNFIYLKKSDYHPHTTDSKMQKLLKTISSKLQENKINYPIIVKPILEGSSVGISKVDHKEELAPAIFDAFAHDNLIIIEQWIAGFEYTASIIEQQVLPLIKIIPNVNHGFYDYNAKYITNDTSYILEHGLSKNKVIELQELVLHAFNMIGCSGWGRVDLMLDNNNIPYLIEINTAPGMTNNSLVPKAANYIGISFPKLVQKIIEIE